MSAPSRIVIVGAGLTGLAQAVALARHGLAVVLIDRRSEAQLADADFDTRVTAVAAANVRALSALALWPELAAVAQPITDILVTDGRLEEGVSPLHLHFDHAELGPEPMGSIVENGPLRRALFQAAAGDARVDLRLGQAVAGIDRGAGRIALGIEGGASVEADLLIAADGHGSRLRDEFRIKTMTWSYPQTSIVQTVAHERDHEGIAQEYFLPAGPFAILPMTGRRSSLVWTERTAVAQALAEAGKARYRAELGRRFGDYLGALEPQGPRQLFPLSFLLSRRFIAERLALIGDAAHTIHPIAGQGFNLGLKDVAVLTELVVDAHRLGLDPGAATVLEDYQRWRRFDTVTLAAVTDLFNRLFSNDLAPLRSLRRLGLGLVNEFGPARLFFMRHAAGDVGTLPKLLQGKRV